MIIEILDDAAADLVDGFRFYEQQSEGLGDYFLDSLYADIESLRIFAGVHELHFGYHRLFAKRFPFAVYYKSDGKTIRVWSVLDCRRDPAWVRKRLT